MMQCIIIDSKQIDVAFNKKALRLGGAAGNGAHRPAEAPSESRRVRHDPAKENAGVLHSQKQHEKGTLTHKEVGEFMDRFRNVRDERASMYGPGAARVSSLTLFLVGLRDSIRSLYPCLSAGRDARIMGISGTHSKPTDSLTLKYACTCRSLNISRRGSA